MNEAKLVEKLQLIEALFSGATTEGEKIAAERARERILERLERWAKEDPPVEYQFSMADVWSRKVFVALLRRYGIQPYRYGRQRRTTVMAKVSQRFVDETLWPEFQQLSEALRGYLSDVTDRVVRQVIHQDSTEAEVIAQPKQLPLSVAEPSPRAEPTKPNEPTGPTEAPAEAMEPNDGQSPSGPAASDAVGAKEQPPTSPGQPGRIGNKERNKSKRKRRKDRKRR